MTKGSKKRVGISKPHIPISVASMISDADRKLFTAKELEELEAEVTIEISDEMLDEARQRVRESLKAQKRLEMQRKLDPDEELYFCTIDLAPFADRMTLDGVVYLHGATYEVPHRQYDTMREIMSRSWQHEASIGNANSDNYRKPHNFRLGPRDAATPASQLMRV